MFSEELIRNGEKSAHYIIVSDTDFRKINVAESLFDLNDPNGVA